MATALNLVVNAVSFVISGFEFLASLFTGDFAAAADIAAGMWDTFVDSLMSIADLFGIGDWLRSIWAEVTTFFDNFSLFESGKAILNTLGEGLIAAKDAVVDKVTGIFQSLRDLLPFSDAKEGPLSQLTLSGTRLMSTLAEGVEGGAGTLQGTLSGALGGIGAGISDWWDNLFGGEQTVSLAPAITPISAEDGSQDAPARTPGQNAQGGNSYTIHIGSISLPGVRDGADFMSALEELTLEYGEGLA
jgi:hypothetical protein